MSYQQANLTNDLQYNDNRYLLKGTTEGEQIIISDVNFTGTFKINGEEIGGLYYLQSDFINASAGASDAGKPVVLDASGKLSTTFLLGGDTSWKLISPDQLTDPVIYTDNSGDVIAVGNETLAGDLRVDGGQIGLSTDTDLLSLVNNILTVNGRIQMDGTSASMVINRTDANDPTLEFQLSTVEKAKIYVDNDDSDKLKIECAQGIAFIGDTEFTGLLINIPTGDPALAFQIADVEKAKIYVDDDDSDILKFDAAAGHEFLQDVEINGNLLIQDDGNIGIDSDTDLMTLSTDNLIIQTKTTINTASGDPTLSLTISDVEKGKVYIDDNDGDKLIIESIASPASQIKIIAADGIHLSADVTNIDSNLHLRYGDYQFNLYSDPGDVLRGSIYIDNADTDQLRIRGYETIILGDADEDVLEVKGGASPSLFIHTYTEVNANLDVHGNIKLDDDSNIGITSDPDLLQLSDEILYVNGWVNATGFTGIGAGVQGATGVQGVTGLQGQTGVQGATGVQGQTGIQGVTGLQGQTGIQGQTGVQGVTGLQGVQGQTGIQGQTGALGNTGVQGIQGITGLKGFTGVDGPVGQTGIQGITGLRGHTGALGNTGLQGQTGIQGVTGLQGQTGIQGVTGAGIGGATAILNAVPSGDPNLQFHVNSVEKARIYVDDDDSDALKFDQATGLFEFNTLDASGTTVQINSASALPGLQFSKAGTEKGNIYIDGSDDFLMTHIGSQLQINESGSQDTVFGVNNSAGNPYRSSLEFQHSGTMKGRIYVYNDADDYLVFEHAGTGVRINEAGTQHTYLFINNSAGASYDPQLRFQLSGLTRGKIMVDDSDSDTMIIQSWDDLDIDCGANKTIRLLDTVWDDQQVNLGAVGFGASAPTWTDYKDGEILAFDKAQDNQIKFRAQFSHKAKQSANFEFHVHDTVPDNGSGVVRWILTVSFADIGGTFPASTSYTTDQTIAANSLDDHLYFEIDDNVGSTSGVSGIAICSLTREGTHANDTYNNDCYLVAADFHIEIDTIGSRQEGTK